MAVLPYMRLVQTTVVGREKAPQEFYFVDVLMLLKGRTCFVAAIDVLGADREIVFAPRCRYPNEA